MLPDCYRSGVRASALPPSFGSPEYDAEVNLTIELDQSRPEGNGW